MKTSRFSDAQIIAILKQAESGSPVPSCAVSMAERALAHTVQNKVEAAYHRTDWLKIDP